MKSTSPACMPLRSSAIIRRAKRLSAFRSTAFFRVPRETNTPHRLLSASRGKNCSRKNLPRKVRAGFFRITSWIGNLLIFGNTMVLDRKGASALFPAASKHAPASTGSHASEKPMCSRPLSFFWLIGSRHTGSFALCHNCRWLTSHTFHIIVPVFPSYARRENSSPQEMHSLFMLRRLGL
jgi:hypothetical protein